MLEQQLDVISDWFSCFVESFRSDTPALQRNYDLKTDHTHRVREVIDRLAYAVGMPVGERKLASAIAICHDVGRFPQYRQYGTFNDSTSTNHAALGIRTLREEGVLDILDEHERSLLLQSVALHNLFALPGDLDPLSRLCSLLIRDADKLDIWRVMVEYFRSKPEERASAVVWELPDTGVCSAAALAEVTAGRMLNRSILTTVDDFKLLQLSWVFDFNLDESFVIMNERGYIDALAALLPGQPGCEDAIRSVRDHVNLRLKQ